ncbi:hypothetical protein H7992_04865 [Sporosarcina sp. resist]|uniref:hypothetical protein n=1 Tax=Sporosarcina sp. resist TaxID=2762563 RepID=UPI00164DCB92|nr:hypothetical protein [Sporosarcina sp. resist]QNK89059.1 hypothetical protein H7992_04865 [Sporosarcina sp. resist]
MDAILNIEQQPDVEEMDAFLKSLPEQLRLQIFGMIQGVRLGLHFSEEANKTENNVAN